MTLLLWKHNVVILYIAMETSTLELSKFKELLVSYELEVSVNQADGNCFFEAISEILYGEQKFHYIEREKNCNWVIKKIESLKVNPITLIPPTRCKTIEELLDQLLYSNIGTADEKIDTVEMCKNYTYAGLHQILATSLIHKLQIVIFHEFIDRVERYIYNPLPEEKDIRTIFLHYSTSSEFATGHYQAIVHRDKAKKKPQTLNEETLDELLKQFPLEYRNVITQLYEFKVRPKYIKKVIEEGHVLGRDIGDIMDQISTMQEVSSPKSSPQNNSQKGTRKASPRKANASQSNSPRGTRRASPSQSNKKQASPRKANPSQSNSPRVTRRESPRKANASQSNKKQASPRKANPSQSNSPRDTRRASPSGYTEADIILTVQYELNNKYTPEYIQAIIRRDYALIPPSTREDIENIKHALRSGGTDPFVPSK